MFICNYRSSKWRDMQIELYGSGSTCSSSWTVWLNVKSEIRSRQSSGRGREREKGLPAQQILPGSTGGGRVTMIHQISPKPK